MVKGNQEALNCCMVPSVNAWWKLEKLNEKKSRHHFTLYVLFLALCNLNKVNEPILSYVGIV